MPFGDLREFVEAVNDAGELRTVEGAHWEEEIGAITELVAEKGNGRGGKALLFDDIEGYPSGYRIITNTFGSFYRSKVALNRSEDTPLDIVDGWRTDIQSFDPIDPEPVDAATAPVRENVKTGDDIDVYEFPTPKWHEQDGGRYIGTGSTVIMRDPETGWVNLGVYRSMLVDDDTVSLLIAKGHDGDYILKKYHERGEACPVALVAGVDPHTWIATTYTGQRQEGEYGIAGWIRGEPIPVVEGEATDLPIPATAEIVLEGHVPPVEDRSCVEGPFAEWVGYSKGKNTVPVIEVESVSHRDDPIMLGQPPLKPPCTHLLGIPIRTAGAVWSQLESAGVPGIEGVWSHVFERPMFLVVAIDKQYPGHSKQVATAAMSVPNGAYGGKIYVVVDDDVDVTNLEDVIWAICTRAPAADVETIQRVYTNNSYPLSDLDGRGINQTSDRLLIDATRPIDREFPTVNQFSDEYRREVLDEWGLDDAEFAIQR